MKNLAKAFCLLLVGHVCNGQQNDLDGLKTQYTIPVKKEIKKEPLVYVVHEASFEKTITADIVPILNKDYALLEKSIKTFQKDSIYYNGKLETAVKKQNDLLKIKTMINEFIVSSENFENKKEKLVAAQKLSDEYNLEQLIYADKTINSKKSTDFLILQIDDTFLKRHLKRVIWHIEDLFMALPMTNAYIVNQNLQKLRKALKGIKKYRYTTGTYKNIIRDGMVVSQEFDHAEFFKSDFEQLGTYFILYNGYKDKFQKGELIDQNTAIENNLIGTSHSGGSWELLKQKNTGILYLIDFNFVDEHAFFNAGKLNTAKLPLKIYSQNNHVVLSE